jgi:hypothetical protein
MEILYVTTACALLTWLKWNQHIQGRSYPFVGISCLYWVWVLANGTTIPFDSVTAATIALAIWMLGAFLWSQCTLCVFEFFVWMSYLTMFTAARAIPLELMMWILVPNAAIMAALQIYNMIVKKHNDEEVLAYPIFGNSNHNAAFMVVGFFASLWIAVYASVYMTPIALLIGWAIVKTRRRGPMIAMVVSLALAAILTRSDILIYLAMIVLGLCVHYRHRFHEIRTTMKIEYRAEIYKDAWKKIHPRYLLGRGLNYYRGTTYGRVHNDHLELVGEVGIIGYALFLNIFLQIHYDPIILCAVVAYFIVAMFFYPLREVHTATPFWAMAGAAAGMSSIPASPFILQAVGICVVFAIMIFVFTIFENLVQWDLARLTKESKVTSWPMRQQSLQQPSAK